MSDAKTIILCSPHLTSARRKFLLVICLLNNWVNKNKKDFHRHLFVGKHIHFTIVLLCRFWVTINKKKDVHTHLFVGKHIHFTIALCLCITDKLRQRSRKCQKLESSLSDCLQGSLVTAVFTSLHKLDLDLKKKRDLVILNEKQLGAGTETL